MYIKPLYIYEYIDLNTKDYAKYIITDSSAYLVSKIYQLDEFYPFCLTAKLADIYFPDTDYRGHFNRLTNSFLHLRKLTYDEVLRYMNIEVMCEYDGVIKDLIYKIILYWDDWN